MMNRPKTDISATDISNFTLPQQASPSFASARSERTLHEGEILIQAGSPAMGLIKVKSGRLKRLRVYKGRAFLAGLIGPGDSTGFDEIFGDGVQRETLEAIGETTVEIESLETAREWLTSAPPVLIQALRSHASRLRPEFLLKKPIDLLPVRARVAATLWLLLEAHGHLESQIRVLNLNLTREEVAHLAGTVYESVIRTLTSLKKEGVIDLNGRVIRVLKEDQLARIGQIAIGDSHVQNTVSQNHSPSHDSSSQEAC